MFAYCIPEKSKSLILVLLQLLIIPTIVHGQGWPEVFDPNRLLTMYLELAPGDWQTVQNDESFDVEVPARFWVTGESPILVSVRRKSADPLREAGSYTKVSLKVDINEYVDGQTWHDLKKLSLENGDDQDVVTEGIAWYLHRLASGPEAYGYPVGLAAWVRVIINGVDTGVYLNVEQPDKQFLKNRDLYAGGSTWLYKMSEINTYDRKVGNGDSPAFQTLCYEPFQSRRNACSAPEREEFAADLDELIDMRGMLTLAAMDGFTASSDGLFTHGKNAYFADFTTGQKRMYLPWDLDSVLGGRLDGPFYPSGDEYSDFILAVPGYRDQFDMIMSNLLAGPLNMNNVDGFLERAELLLTEALATDPNNQMDGSIAEHFSGLQRKLDRRITAARDHFSQTTSTPDMPHIRFLAQNHPNPFNPLTMIQFVLEETSSVQLRIYDLSGRLVKTLAHNQRLPAGRHNSTWDGRNESGRMAAAGVYVYRLKTTTFTASRRMTLLK